jgi:predicted GNAT family acetyltransferase
MLGGAVTGAALFLHIGAGLPLLAAALLVVVTGLAFGRSKAPAVLDAPEPGPAPTAQAAPEPGPAPAAEPAPAPGATMERVSDVSQVTNNQAASRFELQADGGLAELTYRRNGKRLVLMHTEVPVELEGRGLGGILVSAAVDYAALEGMTVVPLCPFASGWLERHPDVAARATIDWGDPG